MLYDRCLTILLLKLVAWGLNKTGSVLRQQCAEDSQTLALLVLLLHPPGAPATGGSSSRTGRTVARRGKGCPALWRHWNRWSGLAQKCSSRTASSSQLLMAADQRPQMLQESRAKAFYQCPKSLQKKGVCENTAWYWSVGSIFTFLVTPVISGLHSGKHIW